MTGNSARNGFPRRFLLTGGAGFIGSHVAEALLARGSRLTIVDSLDSSYSQKSKLSNLAEIRRVGNFTLREADICNFAQLRESFEASTPQAVIHLAAKSGVQSSFDDPLAYGYVNVTGTFHVLELCREFGVERLVLGSSSSVYGAACPAPFQEGRFDLQPLSPYAVTKLEAERLAQDYALARGLAVVCLRLFSVYGPRMRPDSAIFKFTHALDSGNAIQILGDGSLSRDFTWIGDVVPAILAALEYSFPAALASSNGNGNGYGSAVPFEIFNLGASSPVSLNTLIAVLEKITRRRAVRQQLPNQPGEVPTTCADNSKAQKLLGFSATTPLENGLEQFVAWYRPAQIRPEVSLARASAD
ncbi:MAG: GDP-mannose 4,6-dehydratase [Candidatus Acidiferrales bacterium]